MTDVVIAGIGQVPVGEHWDVSLRSLAARAIQAARKDAPGLQPQAMYIGNLLGSTVSHQANLGALLTDDTGLSSIEGITVEAAEASSAGAFRLAYLAIASGYVDTALVVGVEKVTDMVGPGIESAIGQILDTDYESYSGLTLNGAAALLMQRYLYEHKVNHEEFAGFAMLGQGNAVNNPNAYFQKALKAETYATAEPVCDPLNLFDISPVADGAAALLLTRRSLAPKDLPHPLIKVTGSAVAIDALSLHDRVNPLTFLAARQSLREACRQAGILPEDADFFELGDAYTIYAALTLEACGFAKAGESARLAREGYYSLGGKLPINTLGGMKGRGNPLGASGAYQLVEAVQQLRGTAGENQLKKARRAMVQSLGGPASTAITHVLER